MPQFTPTTLGGSDDDFIAKLNQMFTDLQNAVNTHHQELLVAVGPGVALVLDVFDRDGLVGSYSYRLDIDNYTGGPQMTIGRRPVAVVAQGDVDVSVAWGTFAAGQARVTQAGDVVISAAGVITGLPKTIFVGIPAGGTAQVYEDQSDPNIIYPYSFTWDGFNWTDIRRTVQILPGYGLHQEMAGEPRILQVYDTETNWVDAGVLDTESEIVTLGDPDDNGIGVNGQVEVMGVFIHTHRLGDGGWSAPSHNPPDSLVTLRLRSAAETWSATDLVIDAGQTPDSVFADIASAIGDKKYVNEVRRFRLELVSIGSGVSTAEGFTWGLIVRPIFGSPLPKDATVVDLI